ncbi:hypothetical protein V6N11_083798 [Hibiscus sabdariffa]|uniref:Uncharacterized protein n=1 Tax=Hibiscus sabdariffa TaxID=183260 RepID=A0ABR2QCK0_9ROSI
MGTTRVCQAGEEGTWVSTIKNLMHLDWTTSWDHSFEASPNSLRAELHLLKVPIFLGLARMLKYEAGSSSYIETPADIGKIYYGYRYELLGTLHQTFKTFSPAPCAS